MKKVLLLGDSIRMGYGPFIKKELEKNFQVIFPEENGRDTTTTLWQANQMFKLFGDFDVIHWNNGYWDMNAEAPMTEPLHPLCEYEYFLKRMALFFSKHSKRTIFATTMPVKGDGKGVDNSGTGTEINYDNDLVEKYNNAAKLIMDECKIEINDLYQFCLIDNNYYKCPDNLHLTENGNRIIARRISQVIQNSVKIY